MSEPRYSIGQWRTRYEGVEPRPSRFKDPFAYEEWARRADHWGRGLWEAEQARSNAVPCCDGRLGDDCRCECHVRKSPDIRPGENP